MAVTDLIVPLIDWIDRKTLLNYRKTLRLRFEFKESFAHQTKAQLGVNLLIAQQWPPAILVLEST